MDGFKTFRDALLAGEQAKIIIGEFELIANLGTDTCKTVTIFGELDGKKYYKDCPLPQKFLSDDSIDLREYLLSKAKAAKEWPIKTLYVLPPEYNGS
jgi:hypothetical protein